MEATSKPEISVVIPNYRGEELLPACLDSVLSQETDVPFEIIVVDDGSDDGSIDLVASRYPQIKLLVNRKNRGPAAAKNAGTASSSGRYIAFLDNDVELQPGWMKAMLARLGNGEERLGACASHILLNQYGSMLNSTGGMINLLGYAWDRGIFNADSDSYHYNPRVMYACSAAMMIKREVLDTVGGFDERFRYLYEDADLGWRMNVYGYEVVYEPLAVARHLLSSTMGDKWLHNLYLYERNRVGSLLKNMEPGTLKWVRRELSFWFTRRMYTEMRNGLSLGRKILLLLCMGRALGWNLLHAPSTAGRRREIGRHRAVPDGRLIADGVLSPQIGDPPMGEDPRAKAYKEQLNGASSSLPRKVIMARERAGVLGAGWYEKEVDVRGVNFRWTGERATVRLRGGGKRSGIVLRTVMAHPDGLSRVAVRVNGSPISTFEVPNYYHLHRIPLPGDVEPGPWEIELQVLNPFLPREVLHVEDRRMLGIAVASIEVT